jgi:hypothetical protein
MKSLHTTLNTQQFRALVYRVWHFSGTHLRISPLLPYDLELLYFNCLQFTFEFQIDFHTPHLITALEVQGRFGNGQGQEFAEWFILQYQKRGIDGWTRYANRTGVQVRVLTFSRRKIYERVNLIVHIYIVAISNIKHTYCDIK